MAEAIVKIKMDSGCDDLFPTKAHEGDAAFDLRSSIDYELKFNEVKAIDLGFAMALEDGWEAQVRPRSGLALKQGLMIKNSPGTVDKNFRGKVCAIVCYTGGTESGSNPTFSIKRGDRIAQMVIKEVPKVILIPSYTLEESDRGTNGFGSSGVK